MSTAPTILIAARDEEARIGETIAALRRELPEAAVIVADDGSRDRTAAVAEQAGAQVVRLPRRGKGQALTLAERQAPAGPLLLCDADVRGALAPLLASGADLTVAAFAEREGGGFGITKQTARALIRMRTRLRAAGAAVRPAGALRARAARVVPAGRRLRLRGRHDDRRAERGPHDA